MTKNTGAHCHKLLASVAVNCAAELYENLMSDNVLYKAWKDQNPGLTSNQLARKFISKNWGQCLGIARATLARLLESPTISVEYKETIMEALVLDASLMKGRVDPAQIIGTTTGATGT
jgi:hypothetical protein